MAVTWDWKVKVGQLNYKDYVLNIYSGGNCLAVQVWEGQDEKTGIDVYQFNGFWDDTEHLKRCLGLSKGYEDIYKTSGLQSVQFNTYWKESQYEICKMAKLFAKAGHKVELYYKEEDTDGTEI